MTCYQQDKYHIQITLNFMNRKLLLFLVVGLAFTLFGAFETMNPNGAPAGMTGSPGDGDNCTSCHGGTATTTASLITSNIPASGYIPGTTYTITATNSLTGSGKMGFEVSPQNAAGDLLGTLTAGPGSKLVGGGKYVTHSNANSTTNSWTFSWTAPVAGTGTVTFYGAFARNKPGPVTLSTLVVQEAASLPGSAGPISGPNTLCAGASASYSIAPVSGATSYQWSVPIGATITSGQGTTAIAVNYSSSASSGVVSVFGKNSSGNGLPSNLAVTVNNIPAAPGTPSGPATIDLFNGATSEYSTSGSTTAQSYEWTLEPMEAGSISGTTTTASVNWNNYFGTATVKVRGVNNCGTGSYSASFSVSVTNTTGIENISTETISIYPSPSNGQFTIKSSSLPLAKWSMVNLSGQTVMNGILDLDGMAEVSAFDHKGLYIIRIEKDNITKISKLVIK